MRSLCKPLSVSAIVGLAAAVMLSNATSASAGTPVGLGVASSFAVLGGSTVTNTGPSVIHGDLGVSPGSATPGVNELPGPATVDGTQHVTDGVAANAERDLTLAYVDAANRPKTASIGADLVGQTLAPGVYAGPALTLTGAVVLDGQNQTKPVFVFKASAMTTATGSTIQLINGATACDVYWQIGSSATLGTNSTFVGTLMALTSISATTGATIQGRLLARNGAVTLDTNTITRPNCTTVTPSSPPVSSPAPSTSAAGNGSGTTTAPGGGGTTSTPAGRGPGGPGVPLRSPGTGTPTTGTPTNGTPNGPSTSPPMQPPHLAKTGVDSSALAIVGSLAILVGAAMLLVVRRRTPGHRPQH